MCQHYETIWAFETAQFRVEYSATPSDSLDLSWDDDGSVTADLADDRLTAFTARVRVIHIPTDAVLGEDYLGECIYANPSDFIDHRGCRADPAKNYGSYFSDMVREAIAEARAAVAKMPQLRAA